MCATAIVAQFSAYPCLHFNRQPAESVPGLYAFRQPIAGQWHELRRAVERYYGVLHLLFHLAHVGTPGVAVALLNTVERAREQGIKW